MVEQYLKKVLFGVTEKKLFLRRNWCIYSKKEGKY